MDWIAIIEALVKAFEQIWPLIAECFDATPEGAEKLRRSQWRIYNRVKTELKNQGLSWREARAGARQCCLDVQAATTDELISLINEAKARVGTPEQ